MSHDDFFDSDLSPRSRRSPSPRGAPSLMPIVEVPTPSEGNTDLGSTGDLSPRSELDTPNTDRRSDEEQEEPVSEEEEEDEEDQSPRSRTKRNKHKSHRRHSRGHIDMTPPEKLLKKAERKAQRYQDKNKVDSCVRELIRCTALARIVFGDGHWKLAQAYAKLAQGYLDLKSFAPQAVLHADFARTIMVGRVQMSESSKDKVAMFEVLVTVYYTLGRAFTILKKYPDAEQSLSKSEKLLKEMVNSSSRERAQDAKDWKIKIYLATARLAARQQKAAVATTNFDKALDLLEEKHGVDAVELIPIFQSLGKVEQSKGSHADHEKAIQHFLQAHSIAAANYKDNSVEVAETARALATAYSNVGQEDAETSAESYLNESLSIYQVVCGPHDERTIDTEDEVARLMIRTDRQEEGLSLLRSGMEAKKQVFGDISPEVAETWKLIGNVHLTLGNSEKALHALKKCHSLECTLFGTNHKKTKDTMRTIDLLMANPSLASRQKKSRSDELKERPRFSSIVSRSSAVGGSRPAEF